MTIVDEPPWLLQNSIKGKFSHEKYYLTEYIWTQNKSTVFY